MDKKAFIEEGMFTEAHVEAAMCLWEYALLLRTEGDDSVYDWLRAGEGSACARQQCINLAKDCEGSYQLALTSGYDDSFDWEFVPRWMHMAMQITEKHDLCEPWIDYIGLAILRDFEGETIVNRNSTERPQK